MKKLTTYEFIEKAKFMHGDRYDYSMTNYINTRTVVIIRCKEHGIFKQTPSNHLNGQNCPICMGRGKGNNERFIWNAKLVHGCPKCNGGVKITEKEFIKHAKEIHGDNYDYSKVNYINSKTKIKIICHKHGIFEMKPNNHIGEKQGCPICGIEKKCLTTTEFIEKAKKIHGNIYDYSLVDYKRNNIKIKIICREHGIFEQKPCGHLNGRGCSQCKIKSKGELLIADWLNQNKISFDVQKSFIDCKNVLPLRYDFYLSKYNTLIEYDGEPHFRVVKYLGGKRGFELRQTNDKIKTEYARDNNIKLLRIPYTEIKNISTILKNNIITI